MHPSYNRFLWQLVQTLCFCMLLEIPQDRQCGRMVHLFRIMMKEYNSFKLLCEVLRYYGCY